MIPEDRNNGTVQLMLYILVILNALHLCMDIVFHLGITK